MTLSLEFIISGNSNFHYYYQYFLYLILNTDPAAWFKLTFSGFLGLIDWTKDSFDSAMINQFDQSLFQYQTTAFYSLISIQY